MAKRKSAVTELDDLRAKLWTTAKDAVRERLRTLELASELLQGNLLTADARDEAASEAHKLTGSLGIFELPKAASLAKSIELLLKADSTLHKEDKKRLLKLVSELQRELAAPLKSARYTFRHAAKSGNKHATHLC